MTKLTFFLILIFLTPSIFACQINKVDQVNYAISTREKQVAVYQDGKILLGNPEFLAFNCASAALSGRWLMVAFGPEVTEYEERFRGLNFTGDFGYKKCELNKSPYEQDGSYEQRLRDFQDNWDVIRSCIAITVEEKGLDSIGLPDKQPGCNLLKISPTKVSFNGGLCFFRPSYQSQFKVEITIKETCKDLHELKKIGVNSSDLYTGLNFYLAGDASGNSQDLKALTNTRVRVSFNPVESLVQASDDFGVTFPIWPEIWSLPDIYMAPMKVKTSGSDNVKFELPLIVNNNCPKKCIGKFCQSVCDYAQPVVGNFSLYELRSSKKELLGSWYSGGIAPGKFVGFIRGVDFELPRILLRDGQEYLIEATFTDPKFDYDMFQKSIRSRLNAFIRPIGEIGNSGIQDIPNLPGIGPQRLLPTLRGVPDLVFNQSLNSVERAVDELRSYLNYQLWPPYFVKSCGNADCSDLDKPFLTLGARFSISQGNNETEINYKLINIFRKSKIVKSYQKDKFINPKVRCQFNQ